VFGEEPQEVFQHLRRYSTKIALTENIHLISER
jgi:hypothetical protein